MSTPTRARALTHGSPSSTRVAVAPPDDDRAQLEATGLYAFLAECLKKEPSAELCRRLVAEEVFDRETLERSWDEVRGALPAAVRKPLADKLRTYSTGLSPLSNAALCQIGHLAPSCDNRWFKKGELVQVFPYCKIFGVRDIDINQQTVEMDMQLTFDWKDESFCAFYRGHTDLFEGPGIDWQAEMHKRCWHPSPMIENCASMKDVFLEHWFAFEPEGRENVLSFRVRLSGKFAQDFELTDLPFDEHFLTVKLRSSLEVTKAAGPDGVKKIAAGVIFCRDEADVGAEVGKVTKASPVQIKDPAQLTKGVASFYEYELVHYTDRSDRSKGTQVGVGLTAKLSDPKESASGKEYQTLRIHVPIRRRPGYYLWNFVLVQLFLAVISLGTYFVPEFGDRFEIVLGVLFSAVAFKYTVAESLPNYQTALDWYSFHCTMIILFVCFATVVAGAQQSGILEHEILPEFRGLFGLLVGVVQFLAVHLWFAMKYANFYIRHCKGASAMEYKMLAERTDQVSMRGSWGNKGESAFFQPNWHYFSDQERSAVVEESPWWCWGAKRFEDDATTFSKPLHLAKNLQQGIPAKMRGPAAAPAAADAKPRSPLLTGPAAANAEAKI